MYGIHSARFLFEHMIQNVEDSPNQIVVKFTDNISPIQPDWQSGVC